MQTSVQFMVCVKHNGSDSLALACTSIANPTRLHGSYLLSVDLMIHTHGDMCRNIQTGIMVFIKMCFKLHFSIHVCKWINICYCCQLHTYVIAIMMCFALWLIFIALCEDLLCLLTGVAEEHVCGLSYKSHQRFIIKLHLLKITC